MEQDNAILKKSFDFGVRVVKMYEHLSAERKGFPIFQQVLKSGTSIGANVEEAVGGTTKKDFTHKLGVAYKEARETSYWLRLLYETGFLEKSQFESIHSDCKELLKLLYTIIKRTKDN